jgi:hypothetical protein
MPVILSAAKNLAFLYICQTLRFAQGDIFGLCKIRNR